MTTIVFYNPAFPGMDRPEAVNCGHGCVLTADLALLGVADAVVFHVPTLGEREFPAKRHGQRWVAWSMESDVNYPQQADPDFMRRFDLTMTYRRDATVWSPYFGPLAEAALRAPPQPKVEVSPAVYFQSSPVDRAGRTAYAAALMRRVKVDSYGRVLHNRDLPMADGGRKTRRAVIARYKFTLAFENSIAEDYVTEKLFDPLIAGSVPVYRGAPNVRDFAPAEGCLIDAEDFAGPAELAEYLNWLDANDDAYSEYLAWKSTGPSASFRVLVDRVRERAFCRLCACLR